MKLALILLSILGLTWSQQLECHCGLFATVDHMSVYEVYRLLPLNLNSCDELNECSFFCFAEWDLVYTNGGLDYIPPGETLTVGEQSCINLNEVHGVPDMEPTPLYNYYRVCDGPWIFDGGVSNNDLCCANGVQC
ncbi:hypothetical protein SK128_011458 [Halocaridina rubra]|uniref:Uncharacterized protein n=1 Tax=Halocaridina rubra TaxID=373956 RepID=A0AAN8X2V9_HALRR